MGPRRKIGRNEQCPCGSRLKYKRCHIGDDSFYLVRPLVHEKIEPLSFRGFAKKLEEGPLGPLSIATSITEYYRKAVDAQGWTTKDGFHVRDAGATVLAAFYRDGVTPFMGESVPGGDPAQKNGLVDFVHQRLESASPDGRLVALQVLCNQSAIAGQLAFQMFRMLFLLELENVDESHNESFLDPLFLEAHGCTTRQYVALVWAMWVTACTRGIYLDAEGLVRNSNAGDELRPIAQGIFSANSCKTDQVKSIIDSTMTKLGIEGLVPQFFSRYPFLEFKKDTYITAPHPYVRAFASNGPWFQAMALARQEARDLGKGRPETTSVTSRMGGRFEELVEWLLGPIVSSADLVREHIYTRKESAKSPDFLLFENSGRHVTLVQAKLKRLGAHAFFGHNFEAFEKDASGVLAETVWRSIRYLSRIHSDEKLSPEGEAAAARVRGADKIFLLGLSSAMPSVFHVDKFREALDEGIQKNLLPRDKEWLAENRERFAGWHIIDSEELGEFVFWREDDELCSSLMDYVGLEEFGTWLTDGKLLSSFGGAFASQCRLLGRKPSSPEIDSVIARFSDWTLKYLRMDK